MSLVNERNSISVVIPNYNGAQLLPQILPPLFTALQQSKIFYEVIVVDDCSTDNSVTFLKTSFPDIILITNTVNRGFSVAANQGIKASTLDLIFLLNSDVKLTPDYFEKQFRYFEQEDTFGVMGRIVGWNDDILQDGAKYPEWQGFKLKTSKNYLSSKNNKPLLSLYLSGANALIKRDKLLSLNGFNELFAPFYIEDVELSVRAWRSGWKCYYEYDAVCRHKTSTSIRSKAKKRFINTIYNRNKFYFHAIHLNGFYLVGWIIQTFFELILRVVTLRTDYVSSFLAFCTNIDYVRSSRKEFAAISPKNMISLKEVTSIIKRKASAEKISFFRR